MPNESTPRKSSSPIGSRAGVGSLGGGSTRPGGGGGGSGGGGMRHAFDVQRRRREEGLATGGSALLDAVNRGKVHLAKFILDAAVDGGGSGGGGGGGGGREIVNTRDFNGKTPLIRACYIKEEKTRDKMAMLLLSRGANVNLQDDSGRTALSYACEMRCNDIVRILVRNNVDPDIPDKHGNTALIYNAMVGNDVAIDVLVRSFRRLGLNVDHVNGQGLTALIVAAQNGFTECAAILATDGRANVTYRDPERLFNAEQWARTRGCAEPEVLPFSVIANRYQSRLARRGSAHVVGSDPSTFIPILTPISAQSDLEQGTSTSSTSSPRSSTSRDTAVTPGTSGQGQHPELNHHHLLLRHQLFSSSNHDDYDMSRDDVMTSVCAGGRGSEEVGVASVGLGVSWEDSFIADDLAGHYEKGEYWEREEGEECGETAVGVRRRKEGRNIGEGEEDEKSFGPHKRNSLSVMRLWSSLPNPPRIPDEDLLIAQPTQKCNQPCSENHRENHHNPPDGQDGRGGELTGELGVATEERGATTAALHVPPPSSRRARILARVEDKISRSCDAN